MMETVNCNDSGCKRNESEDACVFCNSVYDLKIIAKKPICADCIREIDNVEWESLPTPEERA